MKINVLYKDFRIISPFDDAVAVEYVYRLSDMTNAYFTTFRKAFPFHSQGKPFP